MKAFLKRFMPKRVWWFFRGLFGWRWFDGNFSSWQEAEAASSGYDDELIAQRVLKATTEVREGRAAFERDGITFATYVPEPGLTAAFEFIATEAGQIGSVLDFGGALGTTYWRHRSQWVKLGLERWDVVEQPVFLRVAETGWDERLSFFPSVEAAEQVRRHTVLLASGSVQYLPCPRESLVEWMSCGFDWIVLNNLPLHRSGPDRIALQCVPPEIYPASYPVRFFNRAGFLDLFAGRYEMVAEFASEAEWQVGYQRYASTGLLLKRKARR